MNWYIRPYSLKYPQYIHVCMYWRESTSLKTALIVGSNQKHSFVGGQRMFFQGKSFFPLNDVAQNGIVAANHVIAVAYSRDRCCQRHLKEIWRPDRKYLAWAIS